jgi:uncharacterized protein (UPF0335 family)
MSDAVAQDQLQSFVRRIESVEDEINALNSDKSEIYKEAKGAGFDVKVMRKLIADRRKDASERAEFETIYDLYAAALGMRLYRHEGDQPSSVRAHVEKIEEFSVEHDADGVFPDGEITPEPTDGGSNESASEPAVIDPGRLHDTETIDVSAGGQTNEVATTSAQIVAGEGAHNASVTTFIPKPLRPYCLNTDKCGGQGRQHCWSCQKAHDEAKGVA